MKKLIALALVLVMLFTLASCNLSGGKGGNATNTTTTTTDTSSTTTTTKPTTTTTTGGTQGNNPPEDYTYIAFTSSEKQTIKEILGEVIPFIANNEYYIEAYTYDYDDGTTETGINFYTIGNTQAEFNNYRATYSKYTYDGSEKDDYGDTWYSYTAPNGSYYVDMSYYYYEGEYIVDVYAYILSTSSGGSGSNSGHTYTAFTSSDKALLSSVVGSLYIPFLANDEYYVEEYSYEYTDGTIETGINFYTFGNTKAEFDAYRALFSNYTFDGSEADEYGDMWYFYTAPNDYFYVDMSYYESEYGYVVDVYIYYQNEEGGNGGNGGNGGGSSSTNADVITNAGAGLPSDADGVYDVNFKDAEYVKDVTDQGYFMDGCPTTGSPAVLVIPVQFTDVTAASKGYTTDALVDAFSKGGKTDYYSVYDYYYISSYGQLTLDITVLDYWFTPKYSSSYYYNATYDYYGSQIEIGDQLILDEALAYLEGKMDLSKFDSDGNDIIDAVVLINTLDVGDEDFYWAYRYWNIYTDDQGYYYEYDGVSANDYIWASYQFLYETYDASGNATYDSGVRNPYTYIHEFGHILGLDDYYDSSYSDNELLLDGADMMDAMTGDHNAFSKFNLGWITSSKLVVTNSSVTLNLQDFSKSGDTIIIANNWDKKLGAYQEYYILVYYTNNGLNAGDDYGFFIRDGVVVYHVNASLYKEEYDGVTYYDIYNNNTDASDSYGTEDNLIEFVKSADNAFTYIVGDTMPTVYDDNGNALKYNFTVDAITSEYVTITFTKR